jgi:hypothetical protein
MIADVAAAVAAFTPPPPHRPKQRASAGVAWTSIASALTLVRSAKPKAQRRDFGGDLSQH